MSLSYRKARTRTRAGRIEAVPGLTHVEPRSAETADGSSLPLWSCAEPSCTAGKAPSGPRPPADIIELFPDADGPATGTGLRSRIGGSEAGMATAEYAIATLAAVGFAGLLVVILRSDQVRGFLLSIIEQALSL